MSIKFLKRDGLPSLAYWFRDGAPKRPVAVFLSGFRSDMEGTKAVFLSEICGRKNIPSLRFDYRGHGRSEGKFDIGTIGAWKQDSLDMLDMLGERPVVLIGSSMGGWLGLCCALEQKERMKGFIGLAAAPDFTRNIESEMTEQQRKIFQESGRLEVEDGTGRYAWTKEFLKEGERHAVLDGLIDLNCPVRLVHGQKDDSVPWQVAGKISEAITGKDKKIFLLPESGHRLSSPEDLNLLESLIDEIYGTGV